jgi:sortase A
MTTHPAPASTTAAPILARPGRPRPLRAVRATLARSRGLRRAVSGLAVLVAVAGLALFAYSPATDAYQGRLQARLTGQLASPETARDYANHDVAEGDSLTRIRIPALGVNVVVVEGTSASALRAGAGHYPGTPLPGEDGNVAIAGHRTTYGHPFADLDRLSAGDDVMFDTPAGAYRYRVTRPPFVVGKADWSPIAAAPGRILTLSTCHPKHSDRQRLIVQAELVPEEGR